MPSLEAQALVVKLIPYRESDRVVRLVTREAGLMSAIVPGVRKSHRRFSNLFDLGNHIRVKIARRRKGMGRVESGELIDGFEALSRSATAFAAASHVLELTRRFSAEDQPDHRIFDLAVAAMNDLVRKGVRPFTLRVFELRLLAAAGLSPALDQCVHCGKEAGQKAKAKYSIALSGICCSACSRDRSLIELPGPTRRLMQEILRAPLDEAFEISTGKASLEPLAQILPGQLEYHLGGPLKALHFARRLAKPAGFHPPS